MGVKRESGVVVGRNRGRLRFRGLDGVKKSCKAKSLELSDAKVTCMDKEQWRGFVKTVNAGGDYNEVINSAALTSEWSWTFDRLCVLNPERFGHSTDNNKNCKASVQLVS